MKINIIPAPSAKNPITVLVRLIPEGDLDDKTIKKLSKTMTGMNCLTTSPIIEGKTAFSFIFKRSDKRAGAK